MSGYYDMTPTQLHEMCGTLRTLHAMYGDGIFAVRQDVVNLMVGYEPVLDACRAVDGDSWPSAPQDVDRICNMVHAPRSVVVAQLDELRSICNKVASILNRPPE